MPKRENDLVPAAKKSRFAGTRKPAGRSTRSVGGLFPLAYYKIIEAEAASLGHSKSGFVAMLVRRQLGDVGFERNPKAPTYEVDRADLVATQHYVFYVDD